MFAFMQMCAYAYLCVAGLWPTKAHDSHKPRHSTGAASCNCNNNTDGSILCLCVCVCVRTSVCTCSEVVVEVRIQFCLKAASNPGGRQMAERIESLCRTTVNGKQSAELVNVLFTRAHTHTQRG